MLHYYTSNCVIQRCGWNQTEDSVLVSLNFEFEFVTNVDIKSKGNGVAYLWDGMMMIECIGLAIVHEKCLLMYRMYRNITK